jgi:hypothetical protein
MGLVAVLAAGIAGWVQVDRWKREELEQRKAMMRALPELRVRRIFGRQGVRIIKEATDVEIIPMDPQDEDFVSEWSADQHSPFTETGQFVEPEAAARLSDALLDGSKYFNMNGTRDPSRKLLGLRFRQGAETLEIALGLDPGNLVEVWILPRMVKGELGPDRTFFRRDSQLADLIREIAGDEPDLGGETPR